MIRAVLFASAFTAVTIALLLMQPPEHTLQPIEVSRDGVGVEVLTSVTSLAESGIMYTVAPGDSLASISYQFYGRTDHHIDIYNANRDLLAGTGRIEIGQTLFIPEI